MENIEKQKIVESEFSKLLEQYNLMDILIGFENALQHRSEYLKNNLPSMKKIESEYCKQASIQIGSIIPKIILNLKEN